MKTALQTISQTRSKREMPPQSDPWSSAAIEQNRQWLLAHLLMLTGDPVAADDLVQEVFVIALRKRDDFIPGTNFGAWLRTIAKNVALTHGKRHGREILVSNELALEQIDRVSARSETTAHDPAYPAAAAEAMRKCLRSLTSRVQRLFALRYGEGKSTIETAAATGLSPTAVNVSIFRGRLALTECMKRWEAEQ